MPLRLRRALTWLSELLADLPAALAELPSAMWAETLRTGNPLFALLAGLLVGALIRWLVEHR